MRAGKGSGYRWFYAMGASHEARGLPYLTQRGAMRGWPYWAKQAYCLGRLEASANHAKAKP